MCQPEVTLKFKSIELPKYTYDTSERRSFDKKKALIGDSSDKKSVALNRLQIWGDTDLKQPK